MPSSPEAPRVSVFIQAYNVAPFVEECVKSVLAQEPDGGLEVLAIDDGSTDGTGAVLRAFSDPRLQVIVHSENAGAIATANEGYGRVRGDFVLRIDADDRLHPGALQQLAGMLQRESACGLAYGDVAILDARGRTTVPRDRTARAGRPAVGDEFWPLVLKNFIAAPATMFRRAALARLLPIPSHYRYLDWYLTTGVAETAPTAYVDAVLADYRIHGGSMHHWMVADGSGERTTMDILDRLFATGERAREKARWRRRAYASHYVEYADKYFGVYRSGDARRCYWAALRLRPSLLRNAGITRRLLATFARARYEALKGRLHGPSGAAGRTA